MPLSGQSRLPLVGLRPPLTNVAAYVIGWTALYPGNPHAYPVATTTPRTGKPAAIAPGRVDIARHPPR